MSDIILHPTEEPLNPHVTPNGHGLGWRKQKMDKRDEHFRFSMPSRLRLRLPPHVDLPELPIWDQGSLGSCTANGINFVLQYDLIIRHKHPKIRTDQILSRLMTYWGERWLEGSINEDAGAEIRDGIKFAAKYGTCLEDGPDSWPYVIRNFRMRPPAGCWPVALHYQAIRYHAVEQRNADIRACLADGYPVVFGFLCYPGLDGDEAATTGHVPMPGSNEDPIGGHCVVLVGYDDATRLFRFRNSWGKDWGNNGYGFFDYEYVLRPELSSDFWTVRVVS